jgi:hypothetical protein
MDMLWRRETGNKVGDYDPNRTRTSNTVTIESIPNFNGYSLVLYTSIAANIVPLTAEHLAELSIASAKNNEICRNENGISYLLRAKAAGVNTPLTRDYVTAILRKTGTVTLEHALQLTYDLVA